MIYEGWNPPPSLKRDESDIEMEQGSVASPMQSGPRTTIKGKRLSSSVRSTATTDVTEHRPLLDTSNRFTASKHQTRDYVYAMNNGM